MLIIHISSEGNATLSWYKTVVVILEQQNVSKSRITSGGRFILMLTSLCGFRWMERSRIGRNLS